MFLVKCKCGCIFTLKRLERRAYNTSCPDCGETIELNKRTSLSDCKELLEQVESVSYIPDNAKIEVKFDA